MARLEYVVALVGSRSRASRRIRRFRIASQFGVCRSQMIESTGGLRVVLNCEFVNLGGLRQVADNIEEVPRFDRHLLGFRNPPPQIIGLARIGARQFPFIAVVIDRA